MIREAFANQLFLASAGTGKTYRLSAHFVGLLLQGIPPERILATTFTRKAAGEILGRVLQRLVQVATDEDAAQELSEVLGMPIDRQDALNRLPELARKIHRFQVRTLDAHVIQLAKLFEPELGLLPGWSIVDEVTDLDLRDEALTQALQEAGDEEWMALLRGLDPSGERRGVFQHMSASVRALRDVFLESEADAWDSLRVPAALPNADWKELQETMSRFEGLPRTKAGTVAKVWEKAWNKLRDDAFVGNWEEVLKQKLLTNHLSGKEKFGTAEYPESLLEILDPLTIHAMHHVIGSIRERNLATFQLLERFERSYRELKRSSGWLRFEDLPRLLDPLGEHDLFSEGDERGLEEIWLRMDARIDHLLLDEFQDTSSVQWRTLQPLVEEITSTHGGEEGESRTFFCVGDAKQSIYRWRHAEPRLLEELDQRLPGLQVQTLKRNFRSSPLIMEATNHVFQNLLESDAFPAATAAAERRAVHAFQSAFPEHEAAREEMGGCVQMWLAQVAEGANAAERQRGCLRLAAARVAALRAEAPSASIGVLFRTRKGIPEFLHYLSSEQNLRGSGEGGNPLTDSDAVSVVVSALHLADHPGASAAAFHVGTSHLGAALGMQAADWDEYLNPEDDSAAASLGRNPAWQAHCQSFAMDLRRRVLELGYSEWLLALRPAVEEHFSTWDRVRFDQLIDACDSFAQSAPLRPGQLARVIRESRVPSPWSASIQAMTVHASKGLEFDVVVLPELDSGWFMSGGLMIGAFRPDPAGRFEHVSILPSKDIAQLSPGLLELSEGKRETDMQEVLNLLYVAITRARRRLEFISSGESKAATYHGLVQNGLGAWAGELQGTPQVVQHGDATLGGLAWEKQTEFAPWWEAPKEQPDAIYGLSSGTSREPIGFAGTGSRPVQRTPSQLDSSATARPRPTAGLLKANGGSSRGTFLHTALESIEWSEEETVPAMEASLQAATTGAERTWLQELQSNLAKPGLAGLFAKPSADAQALRERRFLFLEPGAPDVLWSGSVDRVVVEFQADKATAARVIDFKTGLLDMDEEQITQRHGAQLHVYRAAMAKQFGLDPSSVTCDLVLLDRAQVLTVPLSDQAPGSSHG